MTAVPHPSISPATIQSLQDIRLAKCFFLAVYTILLYDHVCTIPLEVETFWKQKKTRVLYLFIFIRYYTPVAMGVVTYGFFSPSLNYQRCRHWMMFMPIAVTLNLMFLSGFLMAIRVYALWGKNRAIFAWLILYLAVQTIVGIWTTTLPGGEPFPFLLNNYDFHYCVFVSATLHGRASSSVYIFMDLAYDTMVFTLTISRTIYIHRMGCGYGARSGSLLTGLARDGALYFGGIFAVNLIWVAMILGSRPGVHAVFAMPSGTITVVLVTRITLNLRFIVYGPPHLHERTVDGIPLTDLVTPQRMHFAERSYLARSNEVMSA